MEAPSSEKAPNPKLQVPEKSQTSKPKMGVGGAFHHPCWCGRASHVLRCSFWCLGFGAFLELGAWRLELWPIRYFAENIEEAVFCPISHELRIAAL
jgi:hypothetical protein